MTFGRAFVRCVDDPSIAKPLLLDVRIGRVGDQIADGSRVQLGGVRVQNHSREQVRSRVSRRVVRLIEEVRRAAVVEEPRHLLIEE